MHTHTAKRFINLTFALLFLVNMLFGAIPPAIAQPSPTGATIASDALDYPIGATVTLTGAGWAANEAVHIYVNDDVGQLWNLNSSPDPVADVNGVVTYKFNLPLTFIATYTVTATGPVSGIATTTFTDSPSAVNLDQCRNGSATSPNDCLDLGGNSGWVNGNVGASQAHMLEGYSTPFRAVMTNLPTGTAITLVIGYDIRNGGANAYDYLTQYQRLEPHSYFGHPAETVYPTDKVSGLSATVSTFPIPAPSSADSPMAGQPTASFNSLPAGERVMTLFGGTISAMAYVSQGSLTANQSETQISITFTVDNPTAVLAWGGHISQCSVWGTTNGVCNSAGGISGSPYHMRLVSWSPNLPNLGNTDRSMAAAVVVQPGNLTLAKALTGGPAGYTGPFTINYNCGTGYTGSVSVNASSSQTVLGIPAGSVCTISETPPIAPTGYTFGTPTFTPGNTITIGQGTTVTVTTNNSLTRNLGSLVLAKALTGGPSGYNGPFTIHYDCGTVFIGDATVAAGGSATVPNIPTGTSCTVSEPTLPTAPTGYSFGTPTFSPGATVIIPAGSGTSVTVTTNNTLTRDTGSLVLTKALTGGPTGYTGPFTINYDCGTGYTGSVSVTAGASQTVSGIPTGTSCTVSETLPTPPTGYSFGTPTFSPSATVTIPAGNGSSVTVTTNNTITRDLGSLEIDKVVNNPDGATLPVSFAVNYDCGGTYAGQVSVAPNSPATVNGIPTGSTCTVTEVAPTPIDGYTWGTATYTPASVVISTKGQTFSITVGNSITRDRGSLEIDKVVSNPDGATLPASFTVNYDCGAGYTGLVSVAPGSPATVNGIPTGNNCSVTEVAPAVIPGYTWGTITYTPPSVVISTKGQTFSITVGNTITRDRGSFQILKTVSNPDGATLPASFTVNYDCGTGYTGSVSVAPSSPVTVDGIPTGNTCTVAEVAPDPITGYTWGTITYSPATVTIDTKGQTFTITVGNSITRDRGTLTIAKTLSNPDGASVPASFSINYNCGAGYTGSVSVAAGGSATVSGIPTGNTCSVSEAALTPITGYTWGTPTVTPASVVISDMTSTFTLTVANSITRDRGKLTIAKTLSNPDGASVPASFTINYDCGTGYTGSVSVAAGGSQTVSGIPTGNTCSVSEAALTTIPGYTWGTPVISPDSVVIADMTSTFTLTVANSITRDRGTLDITKTVDNQDGATLPASFKVTYDCGGTYTGTTSITPGVTTSVPGIPTGSICSVTEVAPNPIAGYTWGAVTYTPAFVTISTKNTAFTITVGNSITRNHGSLVLAKALTGGPTGYTGPFTLNYDCGTGFTGSVSVSAGSSQTISGIPTLTSCTVSEPTLPSVSGYTFGTPSFSPADATVVIPDTVGATISVTTNNTLTRDTGSLKIIKTVTGASFSGTFNFSVVCTGDGGTYNPSFAYPTPGYVVISGIPTGNTCTVTEPTMPTPPAGYIWGTPVITGSPATISKGATVEVTVANTLLTGHAQVVKTVGGLPISATNNCMDVSGNIVGCTFQLRQGASTTVVGTILETQSTLVGTTPVGTLNFTTLLTPGQTYQMCEIVMPGWLTSLGTFVPNSFMPPDGVAPNPAVDNSILCGNFVAQPDTTTVGNVFTIDNTPPPGGRALTIGFWKNWASCTKSNGNQKPILDETLAKAETNGIVVSAGSGTYPVFGPTLYLVLHGSTTNKQVAPDCSKAVNLLNKTTIDGKKKMASDPAFNLAAQLVAAELNYVAGAGKNPAVTTAIQQAVLLLGKYQFNGLTHKTISAADATLMNTLATTLDNYNNNR